MKRKKERSSEERIKRKTIITSILHTSIPTLKNLFLTISKLIELLPNYDLLFSNRFSLFFKVYDSSSTVFLFLLHCE